MITSRRYHLLIQCLCVHLGLSPPIPDPGWICKDIYIYILGTDVGIEKCFVICSQA